MTLVGASYSPWQTWNGKADSQWAQVLHPLEHPLEHGGNRTLYAHLLAEHYARRLYHALRPTARPGGRHAIPTQRRPGG